MGSRQHVLNVMGDQENAGPRLLMKQELARPVQPVRRGALGEVGNKMNGACLKSGITEKLLPTKKAICTKVITICPDFMRILIIQRIHFSLADTEKR